MLRVELNGKRCLYFTVKVGLSVTGALKFITPVFT